MGPEMPSALARFRAGLKWSVADRLLPDRVFVARGNRARKMVALTFDDGPSALTDKVLATLKSLSVSATFCVLGKHLAERPEAAAAYRAHGHEVTSHGYTHRAFPKLSFADLREELDKTQALLPSPSRFVRPPRGAIDARSLTKLAFLGYSALYWSRDSDDCRTEDPLWIAERIMTSRPGEIILLHESQEWTLDAVARAVPDLKRRGFSFGTVSDLLR